MQNKIGIVSLYIDGYGKIESENEMYTFLHSDLIGDASLEKGCIVNFRGEKINDINRAFFVKKHGIDKSDDIQKVYVKKD